MCRFEIATAALRPDSGGFTALWESGARVIILVHGDVPRSA